MAATAVGFLILLGYEWSASRYAGVKLPPKTLALGGFTAFAIGNAIGDAFKTVVNSIIGFAEGTINMFIKAINGAIGLINSCGNLGGWVGPYMMGFIKTETGSFDLGYFAMALFMLIAGITTLTIKYGWTGQKNRQPVTENTTTDTVAN